VIFLPLKHFIDQTSYGSFSVIGPRGFPFDLSSFTSLEVITIHAEIFAKRVAGTNGTPDVSICNSSLERTPGISRNTLIPIRTKFDDFFKTARSKSGQKRSKCSTS
jgi:hypothetical protein